LFLKCLDFFEDYLYTYRKAPYSKKIHYELQEIYEKKTIFFGIYPGPKPHFGSKILDYICAVRYGIGGYKFECHLSAFSFSKISFYFQGCLRKYKIKPCKVILSPLDAATIARYSKPSSSLCNYNKKAKRKTISSSDDEIFDTEIDINGDSGEQKYERGNESESSNKAVKKFNRLKQICLSSDEENDANKNSKNVSSAKKQSLENSLKKKNVFSSSEESIKEKDKFKLVFKKTDTDRKSVTDMTNLSKASIAVVENKSLLKVNQTERRQSCEPTTLFDDDSSKDWEFINKKTKTNNSSFSNLKAPIKSMPSLVTSKHLKSDASLTTQNVQRKTILIQERPATSKYVTNLILYSIGC